MKIELFLAKFAKIKFFVVMALFGIIFSVAGAFFLAQPKTEMITTTATVKDIQSTYDSASETTDYTVTVTYTDAQGVEYTAVVGYYYSGMKVGSTFDVQYDPSNPENVSTPGSEFLPYIFLVVGIICLIIGLIKIIKTAKTSTEDMNDFNKVDMNAVTPEQIAEVQSSTEQSREYYFHFTQQLNQGYIMETTSREPIYEAKPLNVAILTKYKYNFINHMTHCETVKEVTHTVSSSYGNDNISIMTDSHFKIDGVNCWTALGKMGYSIQPCINGLRISFDIMKYGIKVAHAEQAGANVATGKNYKLGNVLPAAGVFTLECRESDIEGVFLACFIFSKTYN